MLKISLNPYVAAVLSRHRLWSLAALAVPGFALAGPTGGEVVAGDATISTPGSNTTQIDQTTQGAVINWQQFSVGSAEYVVFNQPNASAAVLNRVIGGIPSEILGQMQSNGRVFLVNPNGVLFGEGAQIDVGSLTASTLDISNEDFMGGRYHFAGNSEAAVINQGSIKVADGGYVVLAGDYVKNSGVIQARLGDVALMSGSALTLDIDGSGLVGYSIDAQALSDRAGVENMGTLLADGGSVVMTAEVARSLIGAAVNNEGRVQAHSIEDHEGEIWLSAAGGSVRNAGVLDASGTQGTPDAGEIHVASDQDIVLEAGSLIDASGADDGDGGEVRLIAGQDLTFKQGATIDARPGAEGGQGGLIELSAREGDLLLAGEILLSHGRLIIDPDDLTIAQGGTPYGGPALNTVYEQDIESQLSSSNDVVLVATNSITLSDLSIGDGADGELDGRNISFGYGGSLTLGIGTCINRCSDPADFQRGPGEPDPQTPSGIFFENLSNGIRVDEELALIAGAQYGGLRVGDLEAGTLRLLAADFIIAGDLNADGDIDVHVDGSNPLGAGIAVGNIVSDFGGVEMSTTSGDLMVGDVIVRNGDIVLSSSAEGDIDAGLLQTGDSETGYGLGNITVQADAGAITIAAIDAFSSDDSGADDPADVILTGDSVTVTGDIDVAHESSGSAATLTITATTGGVTLGTPVGDNSFNVGGSSGSLARIVSPGLVQMNGDLISAGNIEIEAGQLNDTVANNLVADGGIAVTTAGSIFLTGIRAAQQGPGDVVLDAGGDITVTQDIGLKNPGLLQIDSARNLDVGGTINATIVDIETAGSVFVGGSVFGTSDIAIVTGADLTVGGSLSATSGDITADISNGDTLITGDVTTSGGSIRLTSFGAGSDITVQGNAQSSSTVDISAAGALSLQDATSVNALTVRGTSVSANDLESTNGSVGATATVTDLSLNDVLGATIALTAQRSIGANNVLADNGASPAPITLTANGGSIILGGDLANQAYGGGTISVNARTDFEVAGDIGGGELFAIVRGNAVLHGIDMQDDVTITAGDLSADDIHATFGDIALAVNTAAGSIDVGNLSADAGAVGADAYTDTSSGSLATGDVNAALSATLLGRASLDAGSVTAGQDVLLQSPGDINALDVTGNSVVVQGGSPAEDVILGDVVARTGDLVIDAATITADSLDATVGSVVLTAHNEVGPSTVAIGVDVAGAISAGTDVIVDAVSSVRAASISAGNDVAVSIASIGTGGNLDTGAIGASGGIALTVAGGSDAGGDISVTSLSAGSGDIDILQDGALYNSGLTQGSGNLTVTAGSMVLLGSVDFTGGDVSLTSTAGDVATNSINAGPNLSVNAAGAFNSGGDLTAETITATAAGLISVGDLHTAFLSLDAGDTLGFGTLDVTDHIDLTAGNGDIQAGAVTLTGSFVVNAEGGGIILTGDVDTGGDIELTAASSIAANGIAASDGAVDLDAGLGMIVNGPVSGTTVTLISADGNLETGDIIASGDVTTDASNGDIVHGSIDAGGAISLTARGAGSDISTASLTATTLLLVNSDGSFNAGDLQAADIDATAAADIDVADITASTLSLIATAGTLNVGALDVSDSALLYAGAGDLALGDASVTTSFSATAASGALTAGDIEVITGDLSLDAAGMLDVGDLGAGGTIDARAGGTLSATSIDAGADALLDAQDIAIANDLSAAGLVQIRAITGFTVGGAINATDLDIDVSDGEATLSGDTTLAGSLDIAADSISLGDVTAEGHVVLAADNGSIDTGSVNVTATDIPSNIDGYIQLTAVGGHIDTGGLSAASRISASATGGIHAVGNVLAGGGDGIRLEADSIWVQGDLFAQNGGSIYANTYTGAVGVRDITADGSVSLNAPDSINVRNINAGDSIELLLTITEGYYDGIFANDLIAGGDVTVAAYSNSGQVSVSSIDSGGDVLLDGGAFDISFDFINAAGNATLQNVFNVHGGSVTADSVSINASEGAALGDVLANTGDLFIAGTYISTNNLSATNGNVTLRDIGDVYTSTTQIAIAGNVYAGGNVDIAVINKIDITGTVTADHDVSINSSFSELNLADVTAGNNLLLYAGGFTYSIPLSAGNLTAISGNIDVRGSQSGIFLGNISAGGDAYLQSYGDMTLLAVDAGGNLEMIVNSTTGVEGNLVASTLIAGGLINGSIAHSFTAESLNAGSSVVVFAEDIGVSGSTLAGTSIQMGASVGDITLGDALAGSSSSLSLTANEGSVSAGALAGSSINVYAFNNADIDGSITGENLSVTAENGILDTGAVLVTGSVGLSAGSGNITLLNTLTLSGYFGAFAANGAVNVGDIDALGIFLTGFGGISSGDLAAGSGGLQLSQESEGGSILTGDLSSLGAVDVTGAGIITLLDVSGSSIAISSNSSGFFDDISTGDLTSTSGGIVVVGGNIGSIATGAIDSAAAVYLLGASDITVDGTLNSVGDVQMDTLDGALIITDAATIGGVVSLRSENGSIDVQDVTAAGSIHLGAGSGISGGDLTSSGAGIDIGSNAQAIVLGALDATEQVSINAFGGDITTLGISSGTYTDLAATGAISTGDVVAGDSVSLRADTELAGGAGLSTGAVSGTSALLDGGLGNLSYVSIDVSGAASLRSGGLTSGGDIDAGSISLGGGTGIIAGNLTAGDGGIDIGLSDDTTAHSIVVGDIDTTGHLSFIQGHGDFLMGNVAATSFTLYGGNSVVTSGDIDTSAGTDGIQLQAASYTGGTLTAGAGAIDIRTEVGDLSLSGDVSGADVLLISVAGLGAGNVTASQGLGLVAGGDILAGDLSAGSDGVVVRSDGGNAELGGIASDGDIEIVAETGVILSGDASGAAIGIRSNTGALSLQAVNADNDLDLRGTSIDAGALAGADIRAIASTGDMSVLAVDASGGIDFNVAGNLDTAAMSAGDLIQLLAGGNTTTGNLAAVNGVLINDPAGSFGGGDVSTGDITVSGSGMGVRVGAESGSLLLGNITTNAGDVRLRAGQDVLAGNIDTGALLAAIDRGEIEVTADAGDIALGNLAGGYIALSAPAGSIATGSVDAYSLNAAAGAGDLVFGNLDLPDLLILSADNGSILVGDIVTGSLVQLSAEQQISAGSIATGSGGIALNAGNGASSDALTTTGFVTVDAGTGSVSVGDITAQGVGLQGADILAGNIDSGALDVIAELGSIQLGDVVADSILLSLGNDIAGNSIIVGNLTTTGSFALDTVNAAQQFGDIVASSLDLASVNGAIQTGDIKVDDSISLVAGGSGGIVVGNLAGSALNLDAANGALFAGNIDVSGIATLNAGGALFGGDVEALGLAADAGGGITLGSLTLGNNGLDLGAAGDADFGDVSSSGDVVVVAGADLDGGAITAADVVLTASGGNLTTGNISATGSEVLLSAGGSVQIGALVADTLGATAGQGDLSFGDLTLPGGLTLAATAGNIIVGDVVSDGLVQLDAAQNLSTGDLDADIVALTGASVSAGNIDARSLGVEATTGSIAVGDLDVGDFGFFLRLLNDSAANSISAGDIRYDGPISFALTQASWNLGDIDSQAFSVVSKNGAVSIGDVAASSGDIFLSGGAGISFGDLATPAGITLAFGADSQFNGTTIDAGGAFAIDGNGHVLNTAALQLEADSISIGDVGIFGGDAEIVGRGAGGIVLDGAALGFDALVLQALAGDISSGGSAIDALSLLAQSSGAQSWNGTRIDVASAASFVAGGAYSGSDLDIAAGTLQIGADSVNLSNGSELESDEGISITAIGGDIVISDSSIGGGNSGTLKAAGDPPVSLSAARNLRLERTAIRAGNLLLEGGLAQAGDVALLSSTIDSGIATIVASGKVVDEGDGGSIDAAALGVRAGSRIELGDTAFTVGNAAAAFGGDAVLLEMLAAVAPELVPSSLTPNAAFIAADSVSLGVLNMAGDHLYLETTHVAFNAPVSGTEGLFVDFSPFFLDQDMGLEATPAALRDFNLDNAGHFSLFPGATLAFGAHDYSGDIIIGEQGGFSVLPQDTNFVLLTRSALGGHVIGPDVIGTNGQVIVLDGLLTTRFSGLPLQEEFEPLQTKELVPNEDEDLVEVVSQTSDALSGMCESSAGGSSGGGASGGSGKDDCDQQGDGTCKK